MNRLVSISEAATALGVSVATLRRWEAEGRLTVDHTAGGHRRYDLVRLRPLLQPSRPAPPVPRTTLAYARVSSNDQRGDLERQKQVLELYCARQGWTFELIADLGSGMNYQKKGLKRLLDAIISGAVERLVLTHKDRLLRFGAELVFDSMASASVFRCWDGCACAKPCVLQARSCRQPFLAWPTAGLLPSPSMSLTAPTCGLPKTKAPSVWTWD